MAHDDLTDIVMTWPMEVGEQYWDKRLIDLSGMPFTNRYSVTMLDRISRDGKLYYLPGPAQVRGIVYNKTLFREKGWQVPRDYKGFLELCRKIESDGIRAIQLGFGNPEVLDTAFVGYNYGEHFSSPADVQWLNDYSSGHGSFGDRLGPALDVFREMIDAGVWKRDDLNITYSQREAMLFTRKCAMIEDSALISRMGNAITGTTDKFVLMPFFNPDTPSDWARLYMVCYIGLNKHLTEPQNREKYNLVLKLMDYISTPEGQSALMADTGAMYSSVNSVPPPNVPEIADIRETLRQGRYAIFPELRNAQGALRRGLAGMLAGTHSKSDVIRMIDKENHSSVQADDNKVIGMAAHNFTVMETGNFITDAMRAASSADIALFMDNGKDGKFKGKGVSGRIYKGPQTTDDITRIMPDLKYGETGTLQVVTMTGKDLVRTLEHSIPIGNNIRGWFYYFSGLNMEYSPAAEPGKRIRKLSDPSGNPIDPEKVYSVAVMDKTVPEDAVLSVKSTLLSIGEVFVDAIRAEKTISPSKDRRFVVCEP